MSAASHPIAKTTAATASDRSEAGRTSLVRIAHAVPGRIRLKVRGLYDSPSLRDRLVMAAKRRPDVTSVRANLTTSCLTLRGPSVEAAREICRQIEEAVLGAVREVLTHGRLLGSKAPANLDAAYAEEAEDVARRLDVDPAKGLDSQRVSARTGRNALPEGCGRGEWDILKQQFTSTPVILLCGSAALSLMTGGLADAALIMGVILANGFIGYRTESQAERIIRSLGIAAPGGVIVRRDGREQLISERDLVVGDVIRLRPGPVPADARILSCRNLTVDESALTGESHPVAKEARPVDRRTVLAERRSMVYAGTVITGGEGLALVVAIGPETELGKIQALAMESMRPPTPLERHLSEVGEQAVRAATLMCGGVLVVGLLRGMPFLTILKTTVSLVVAAVPEGLTTVGTVALARGMLRMREKGIQVRDLDAVEALGGIHVLCLDKTGTVTENRMSIAALRLASTKAGELRRLEVRDGALFEDGAAVSPKADPAIRRLAEIAILCNDASLNEALPSSSTETALLELARLIDLDVERLREDESRQRVKLRTEQKPYMRTYHRSRDDDEWVAIKGSPSYVLSKCDAIFDGEKIRPMTAEDRARAAAANEELAASALRVLAFAYRPPRCRQRVWVGLVGMRDPPRRGVRELIHNLRGAGIRTIMLTGDQSETAEAIGRELRFNGETRLEVVDASAMQEADWDERVAGAHVFARVSPSDKLRIVRALQRKGYTVAMTGDGINDSPALKAADIGIAMGASGTTVAREAADVVVAHDRLEVLEEAVRIGRGLRANLEKSIRFLLATNATELSTTFGSIAIRLGSPFSPAQLLWINLITDVFPALALALEENDEGVMQRAPETPGSPLFDRETIGVMAREALTMTAAVLGPYAFVLKRQGQAKATTTAFLATTATQMLYVLSLRTSERRFELSGPGRPSLWLVSAAALGVALPISATMIAPLRRLLGLAPLDNTSVTAVLLGAAMSHAVNETLKPMQAKRASSVKKALSCQTKEESS